MEIALVGLGCTSSVPNFIEVGAREDYIYCMVQRRRKIRRQSDKFHELISQELLGLLISNLVCKVWYMKALTFVNLVEIGAILYEL